MRLLAAERSRTPVSNQHLYEAVRVCEKLRLSLTRFAGADGFASLLRRSLALARAEAPSLDRIAVNSDCSMDGLEALAADEADGGAEAAVALAAHLLGLLVTFIGEPLTLRLVRESWPDASFDA
ncbi:MAG: hypothetical protein GEV05_28455 [Betaproteobacteria bacterium]|nr:hypothetical protein [Betaproteobacteria bacterium]